MKFSNALGLILLCSSISIDGNSREKSFMRLCRHSLQEIVNGGSRGGGSPTELFLSDPHAREALRRGRPKDTISIMEELGIADGKAFEQMSTEQLTFAYVIARSKDPAGTLDKYWKLMNKDSGKVNGDPLRILWGQVGLGPESFSAWKSRVIEETESFFQATRDGNIMENSKFADILRTELFRDYLVEVDYIRNLNVLGLQALRIFLGSHMDFSSALSYAQRAGRGEFDVPTLDLLLGKQTPSGFEIDLLGRKIFVKSVSVRTALEISEWVKSGKITLAQLIGFYQNFFDPENGPVDYLTPFDAAFLIQAVNRRELTVAQIQTALDPQTYFSQELLDLIVGRVFTAGSKKYTERGYMGLVPLITNPLLRDLGPNRMIWFAKDPAIREKFRVKFEAEIRELLPGFFERWKVRLSNINNEDRWEEKLYRNILHVAFEHALPVAFRVH